MKAICLVWPGGAMTLSRQIRVPAVVEIVQDAQRVAVNAHLLRSSALIDERERRGRAALDRKQWRLAEILRRLVVEAERRRPAA